MLSKLKKLAYNLLCNNLTGTLLLKMFNKIPDLRWKGYRFFVNRSNPNKAMVSSIFFGFYESAEIRLLHKYFKGDMDVIEAGGSLGVVSSHICSLMRPDRKLVVIEANPFLKKTITQNLQQYRQKNFEIVSAAVGYDGEELVFTISNNNTESRVNTTGTVSGNDQRVPAVSLSKVLEHQNIHRFALVSDIEGSEIGFLVNDADALQRCDQIFIELHDTKYRNVQYKVPELVELIKQRGFERIDNEGPVYYFERRNHH